MPELYTREQLLNMRYELEMDLLIKGFNRTDFVRPDSPQRRVKSIVDLVEELDRVNAMLELMHDE